MSRLTTEQIRTTFIDYFKKHDHTHVQSSSLVPHNDPSLMFVNAGMVQFKDVFTGVEKKDYSRAVTAQKAVRAGGKHNDLENVGYTARHHTFFEMLGNFSFGDYFKEAAIYHAWQVLTKEFGLPAEKLYITVYHTDDEAASLWRKITGFNDEKIIRIKTNDNFWSMGETGPCGPCSEIFYDHGAHIPGGLPGTAEEDGDRFIEIWNLVFMQYEQVDAQKRVLLPAQSVDTGMGLERIAAVIQGVHDNYDTDMFQALINEAASVIGAKAEGSQLFSYRIIADHLRAAAFLIADGVMPTNEGRGYVLRRIMRRAMRHIHQLGAEKEPVMYKLLPKLVDLCGHPYTELSRGEEFISSILKQEEERFKSTLSKGLKLLEEELQHTSGKQLSGSVAFKLYDTYGFPLDLTQDILKKQQITVDLEGFAACMQQQKEQAKAAWAGSGATKNAAIWFELLEQYGASEFLGYQYDTAEGKVQALLVDNQLCESVKQIGQEFLLITNQTPFYGESGGQMGDIGAITASNTQIKVKNTLKYLDKLIVHVCELITGEVTNNQPVKLQIDVGHRQALKRHHSATHLLHAALQKILGKHVTQRGSLVAHDKLRFDISHPNAITAEQLWLVEQQVNKVIMQNTAVTTKLMPAEQAIEAGAMALFGEKYAEEVRVVSMGADINATANYSMELCGGTHVKQTGDIGLFKITSESAIAAGIRRIEAICGMPALEYVHQEQQQLTQITDILKVNKTEVSDKIVELLNQKKVLEKQILSLQLNNFTTIKEDEQYLLADNKVAIIKIIDDMDGKTARLIAESISQKQPQALVFIFTKNIQQQALVLSIGKESAVSYNAKVIVNKLAERLAGRGGGSPTMAQLGNITVNLDSNLATIILSVIKDM